MSFWNILAKPFFSLEIWISYWFSDRYVFVSYKNIVVSRLRDIAAIFPKLTVTGSWVDSLREEELSWWTLVGSPFASTSRLAYLSWANNLIVNPDTGSEFVQPLPRYIPSGMILLLWTPFPSPPSFSLLLFVLLLASFLFVVLSVRVSHILPVLLFHISPIQLPLPQFPRPSSRQAAWKCVVSVRKSRGNIYLGDRMVKVNAFLQLLYIEPYVKFRSNPRWRRKVTGLRKMMIVESL